MFNICMRAYKHYFHSPLRGDDMMTYAATGDRNVNTLLMRNQTRVFFFAGAQSASVLLVQYAAYRSVRVLHELAHK